MRGTDSKGSERPLPIFEEYMNKKCMVCGTPQDKMERAPVLWSRSAAQADYGVTCRGKCSTVHAVRNHTDEWIDIDAKSDPPPKEEADPFACLFDVQEEEAGDEVSTFEHNLQGLFE